MKNKIEIKEIFNLDIKEYLYLIDLNLTSFKNAINENKNNKEFIEENFILIRVLNFKMDEHRLNKLNSWLEVKLDNLVSNNRYKDSLIDYLEESVCFNKINNKDELVSEKSDFSILVEKFRIEFEKEKKYLISLLS